MGLGDKKSTYGDGAGESIGLISGRLAKLAKDVENLKQISGTLEGTGKDVKNLAQISGQLESLARDLFLGLSELVGFILICKLFTPDIIFMMSALDVLCGENK